MSNCPHWTTRVQDHPIARLLVPCFGDKVDRVELGLDSMRVFFKLGHLHTPIPLNGDSLAMQMLLATEDQSINFQVSYEAVGNDCGVIPSLAARVSWKLEDKTHV